MDHLACVQVDLQHAIECKRQLAGDREDRDTIRRDQTHVGAHVAQPVVVAVGADGDCKVDGVEFHETLLARSPEQFGTPSDSRYAFYSIVGVAPNEPATEPWFPHHELNGLACDTAPSAGLAYQALSVITDALRFRGQLMRRLKLGLADPLVVDRLLLWSFASLARVALVLMAPLVTALVHTDALRVALAPFLLMLSSVLIFGATVSLWLMLKPSARYRRWVESRYSVTS